MRILVMASAIVILGFSMLALVIQLLAVGLALGRVRPGATLARPRHGLPPISIIRPLCGLDFDAARILNSTFKLDYPAYEIIFCVADANDPVLPLVHRLIAKHPDRAARLLIGHDRLNANPKLNNMAKGWRDAAHDWIVFSDSNVLMPVDYLQRLLAAWRSDTGLVSAPPVGIEPEGFWSELEAGFLNTHQAKVQYAVDSLGFGFAQGKNLFLRRQDLDRAGGLAILASEPAEDAAATKAMRSLGLKVRLASPPFGQPLGRRQWREVWARQLRWARLRRATFPLLYAPEIFAGPVLPLAAAGFAAAALGWPVMPVLLAYAAIWYGAELALAALARWPLSGRSLPAWMLRDALLPVLWCAAWTGSGFVWRGTPMTATGRPINRPSGHLG
jgi:ceramide glucosyltransferase